MNKKRKGIGSLIVDVFMLVIVCGGVMAFLRVNNINSTDDAYSFLKKKSVETEECYKTKGEGCLVLPEHTVSGGKIVDDGFLSDSQLSYKGPERGEAFMNKSAKLKKTYALSALDSLTVTEKTKDKVKTEEWQYFAPVGDSDCWSIKDEVIADQSSAKDLKLIDEFRKETTERKSACAITNGFWVDLYTGEKIKNFEEVTVDHVVSLDTAVKSGGTNWDEAKKKEFANDKENLVVVSEKSKKSRANKSVGGFTPSGTKEKCTFTKNYVSILNKYSLSIDEKDKKALSDVLVDCNK